VRPTDRQGQDRRQQAGNPDAAEGRAGAGGRGGALQGQHPCQAAAPH